MPRCKECRWCGWCCHEFCSLGARTSGGAGIQLDSTMNLEGLGGFGNWGNWNEFLSHQHIRPTQRESSLTHCSPSLHSKFMLKNSQEGMTWLFDNCGGHGDTYGHYHYHAPPLCLMKSLGLPVPKKGTWWKDAGIHAWPAEGPEVQIAWALDGAPIMGPYKDGSRTEKKQLDECHGAVDASGVYRYYLVPEAPYMPPCLKGAVLGNISNFRTSKEGKLCSQSKPEGLHSIGSGVLTGNGCPEHPMFQNVVSGMPYGMKSKSKRIVTNKFRRLGNYGTCPAGAACGCGCGSGCGATCGCGCGATCGCGCGSTTKAGCGCGCGATCGCGSSGCGCGATCGGGSSGCGCGATCGCGCGSTTKAGCGCGCGATCGCGCGSTTKAGCGCGCGATCGCGSSGCGCGATCGCGCGSTTKAGCGCGCGATCGCGCGSTTKAGCGCGCGATCGCGCGTTCGCGCGSSYACQGQMFCAMGLTKKASTGTMVSMSQCNLHGHSITIDAKQDCPFAVTCAYACQCMGGSGASCAVT